VKQFLVSEINKPIGQSQNREPTNSVLVFYLPEVPRCLHFASVAPSLRRLSRPPCFTVARLHCTCRSRSAPRRPHATPCLHRHRTLSEHWSRCGLVWGWPDRLRMPLKRAELGSDAPVRWPGALWVGVNTARQALPPPTVPHV
jgi:hypothetical protein